MNYHVPTSSPGFRFPGRNISTEKEDDIVELLWRNGPVFHELCRKSPPAPVADSALPCRAHPGGGGSCFSPTAAGTELFMEEDEMASWLHYPLANDEDDNGGGLGGELLAPSLEANRSCQIQSDYRAEVDDVPEACWPPVAPERQGTFANVSRSWATSTSAATETSTAIEAAVADSRTLVLRQSTVVDSSDWPELGRAPGAGARFFPGVGKEEAVTCEKRVTSSSGENGERVERSGHKDDRKRKALDEGDDSGCFSEDAKFASGDKKKDDTRSSASAKRNRAAEVHNLSERRRRDRINEKMKALQELIPWCNKSDKASMLEDAIEYLKSLQLQVQMMSMGYSMAPMMFPGVQYIRPMGLGMEMGMVMGMGLGMEIGARGMGRPMLPFPPVMQGSPISGPAAAQVGPRLPMQAFHSPVVPLTNQLRVQATNQPNHEQKTNQPNLALPHPMQIPNLTDSYHQYFGLHHLQVPLQKQAVAEPENDEEIKMPETSKVG